VKTLLAATLGLLMLSACGGHTKADVSRLERDVKWAKAELSSARDSADPLKDYVAQLESGKLGSGYYLMISAEDILKYGKEAYLPYEFEAKSIHKKLTGTFTTKKITDVATEHGNRLKLTLLLQGRDIKVNYKGDLYKPHVKKIKAGLEKGLVVDLSVALSLKKDGKAVVAKAKCTGAKLLANNEDLYRDNVSSAINKVLSKEKYSIALPPKGDLKPAALFTTRSHVVIVYK